ncbi:hypothetical protein DSECCO2_658130 [anaerobic digester metagenome]
MIENFTAESRVIGGRGDMGVGLFPQIPSPDRHEPPGLLDRAVLPDPLKFERHPGAFSRLALPDPDPLPSPLALDVGCCLLSREEDRVAEGIKEREWVAAEDNPLDHRLPGVTEMQGISWARIKYPSSTETPANIQTYADRRQYR